jgi:hypothetical protein
MEQDQGIELLSTEELHNLMPYKRFKLLKWRVTTRATPNIYGIRVKKLSDLPADIANGVTLGFDQFGNRVQASLISRGIYNIYATRLEGRSSVSMSSRLRKMMSQVVILTFMVTLWRNAFK